MSQDHPCVLSTETTAHETALQPLFWRNLAWNEVMEALWGLGVPLVAPTTILAVFLARLGASDTLIGALPAVQMACMGIPRLPAAYLIRRTRRRVPVAIGLYSVGSIGWIACGAGVLALGVADGGTIIVLLLVCAAFVSLAWGAAEPLWADLVARLFPPGRRGLAGGVSWAVFGGTGILGAVYAERVLRTWSYPEGFAHLMILAGILPAVAMQFLRGAVEVVPEATTAPSLTPRAYAAAITAQVRRDRRLRRLVYARWLADGGAAVSVFYAVNAVQRFGVSEAAAGSAAGIFTIILSAAGMVGGLALGRLGDRRGFRRMLAWGVLLQAAGTAVALWAPTMLVYYGAFVAQGMGMAGVLTGTLNLLIEGAEDPADCSTPLAIFGTMMLPVWFAAPLGAGLAADHLSMEHALAAGLVIQLLGWATLVALVDDPRRPGRRIVHWPTPRWRSMPRFMW